MDDRFNPGSKIAPQAETREKYLEIVRELKTKLLAKYDPQGFLEGILPRPLELESIQKAFEKTWNSIKDEIYSLSNLRIVTIDSNSAAC